MTVWMKTAVRTMQVLWLSAALLGAAEFRAAVVKVDITPKTPKWLMGYAARVERETSSKDEPVVDGKSNFVVSPSTQWVPW